MAPRVLRAGGKLVFHTAQKRAKGPVCSVTGKRIPGVSFILQRTADYWLDASP